MKDNRYKDWQELFYQGGDYVVTLRFYESDIAIGLEELYQHFKTRLMDELRAELQSVPQTCGRVVDLSCEGFVGISHCVLARGHAGACDPTTSTPISI